MNEIPIINDTICLLQLPQIHLPQLYDYDYGYGYGYGSDYLVIIHPSIYFVINEK